jgi:hypothetical protein
MSDELSDEWIYVFHGFLLVVEVGIAVASVTASVT